MSLHQDQDSTISSNPDGMHVAGDKTMPLGVGGFPDDAALDPLANVSEGRKFNAGSFVIVIVIIVACGGLWFMRSLSKVSAVTGATSDVEASIESFLKTFKVDKSLPGGQKSSTALAQTDASVLAVLSGSYTERQVPLSGVQRDPFVIYGEAPVAIGTTTDAAAGSFAHRRQEKLALFEKAATRLDLKSILLSSRPLANISGKIVRLGDEFVSPMDDVAFRVAEITKDSVTLIGEDPTLNLTVPVTLLLKREK